MVSHREVKTKYGLKSWQRGITKINGVSSPSKYLLTLNTSTSRYQDEIKEGYVIYQMQKQKRKPIEKFGPTGNNKSILADMESNGSVVQVDLAVGGKNQYDLVFGAYIHDITMKDGYPSFVIKIPSVPRNVMNAVRNRIATYKRNNRQLMLADDVLNFIRVDRSSVFTNLVRTIFGAVLKKFACQRCGCVENIQCAHAHHSRPQVIQKALELTPTVYINGLAFLDREVLKYQFIKLHAQERYAVIPLCRTCHVIYDKEFSPPSL